MKNILILVSFALGLTSYAQDESRWGIMAGVNEYYMNADFLFSKSGMGFNAGIVATVPISEHSEFLAELGYARNNYQLLGRKDIMTDAEWVKFNTQRVYIAAIYDYDLFRFMDDDFVLGLCAGPTLSMKSEMRLTDMDKEEYLFEPNRIGTEYLNPQAGSDSANFDVFGTAGISARYKSIEGSLRYNFALTDIYRNFPATSEYINFTGKDSYMSFQLTFYFGNKF